MDGEVTRRRVASDSLEMQLEANLADFESASRRLHEFLERIGTSQRGLHRSELVFEEVCMNVIRYAYVDDDQHTIEIGLGIIDEQIILEIRDSGRPFDPRSAPPRDLDVEDPEVGGLGLTLVLDLVDALTYRREDDKNRVQVCIHIRSEEGNVLWSDVNDRANAGNP